MAQPNIYLLLRTLDLLRGCEGRRSWSFLLPDERWLSPSTGTAPAQWRWAKADEHSQWLVSASLLQPSGAAKGQDGWRGLEAQEGLLNGEYRKWKGTSDLLAVQIGLKHIKSITSSPRIADLVCQRNLWLHKYPFYHISCFSISKQIHFGIRCAIWSQRKRGCSQRQTDFRTVAQIMPAKMTLIASKRSEN